ncbi:CLIP-associated protein [Linum perenne]
MNNEQLAVSEGYAHNPDSLSEMYLNNLKPAAIKVNSVGDGGPSIPQILHVVSFASKNSVAEYPPSVIVPLLVTEDEKTLVTSISCLTKLVSRLSQEELMTQLSSFLPALFEAFNNQSADVRKSVVFCLVDIYIMLGKSFLPYLEGLNSMQLKLVTIYANRISQARTGAPIDNGQA